MASTRLLLEGSDIESLLAQVRDQYGSGARIVSADKVRSGGIGGFFSKEKYEISVEIDDAATPRAAGTPNDADAPAADWPALPSSSHERAAAAIDSVQALLDLADRQEHQLRGARPPQGTVPGLTLPDLPVAGLPSAQATPPAASPYDSIRATEAFLAARRDIAGPAFEPPAPRELEAPRLDRPVVTHDPMRPGAAAHPVINHEPAGLADHSDPADLGAPSTSGAEFAEILAGLRDGIGPGSAAAPAPSVRPFRPADDGLAADTSDDPFPGVHAILGETLSAETSSSASTIPDAFAPGRALRQPGWITVPTDSAAPPDPPPTPQPATVAGWSDQAAVVPEPALPPFAPAESAVRHAAPAPWGDPAPPHATAPDRLTDDLVHLGLPRNLAQRAVGRDPYSGVVRALGMLPAPPAAPAEPGAVLVVAGELTGAMGVARACAKRMRVDPAAILVAGPTVAGTGLHSSRRLTGAADAAKRAPKLHAADVPTIVVVDAPLDAGDTGHWVRSVVEALESNAVWAVVDATRKTADVARQLRGFGLVDAIAVHGVTATGDPASVLGLGVPVASLDGRRATPQTWAALLCDLLDHPEPR